MSEIEQLSSETIEQAIDAYFTNLASFNSEGWLDIFAEDALIYDPVGNPPSKVYEDYQKFFGFLSSLFTELELSKDNIFVARNGAAVKWTMRVISKNNRRASTEGISIFTMNEAGKIQQVSSYWHEADLISQIQD